jgi:hypothetical protein
MGAWSTVTAATNKHQECVASIVFLRPINRSRGRSWSGWAMLQLKECCWSCRQASRSEKSRFGQRSSGRGSESWLTAVYERERARESEREREREREKCGGWIVDHWWCLRSTIGCHLNPLTKHAWTQGQPRFRRLLKKEKCILANWVNDGTFRLDIPSFPLASGGVPCWKPPTK